MTSSSGPNACAAPLADAPPGLSGEAPTRPEDDDADDADDEGSADEGASDLACAIAAAAASEPPFLPSLLILKLPAMNVPWLLILNDWSSSVESSSTESERPPNFLETEGGVLRGRERRDQKTWNATCYEKIRIECARARDANEKRHMSVRTVAT